MSIANPTTYAEWYWANQVDASKTFADAEEAALAPFINSLMATMGSLEGFPPEVATMLRGIGTPGHFGLVTVAKEIAGDTGKGSISAGLTPFLRMVGYSANKMFPTAFIPFTTACTLALRRKIIPELFESRALAEGLKEAEARLIYEASAPYPGIEDIIRWARFTTGDDATKVSTQEKFDINDVDYEVYDWLTRPLFGVNEIQQMYLRGSSTTEEALYQLKRLGWGDKSSAIQLDLAYTLPSPMVMIQAGLHNRLDTITIKEYMSMGGVHPDWQDDYLNAVLTKPGPQDIIRWRLRHDPNLSELTTDLTRIGVHPDYIPILKELAYPVPPVGDMITMAVREAFSPEIAGRFGQYDDYPSELTRFAAMNGVNEEWCKRYWAAHWSLPSPQQGFEMFHRGIISHDELVMLMRALDIMPFWRDKLIQAAYRTLTRVDVRRMYGLGILSEAEVERSYLDFGYGPDTAKRLTAYTVKAVLASQTGFKVTDVTGALKAGYISRFDASNMLANLGIKSENIGKILDASEQKKAWDIQLAKIRAVENEYKQGVINQQSARNELERLHVPSEKIVALLGQWYKESVERESLPWTRAETVQFFQRGIIDQQRAIRELLILGYNDEHISAILANAGYKKPTATTE